MSDRPISLMSRAGTIDMGAGIVVRRNVAGFGLPPVQGQFFDGAGDGTTWRGSRVLPRVMDLPIKVTGNDRQAVADAFSALARVIAPTAGLVRLTVTVGGVAWYIDVTRTGGGDWSWETDTDGETVILTSITFKSEDPYWTRVDATGIDISPSGTTFGLLKGVGTMVSMSLSTTTGFGAVPFENIGDVEVFPTWTAYAPFDGLTLTSPEGDELEWTGSKATGYIVIDAEAGTIVDELGVNLYDGLNDVPVFWGVQPGVSEATIEAANPESPDTHIVVSYRPKKWILF